MNDDYSKTVTLCKSGALRWGNVSQHFAHAPKTVTILIDHDGTAASKSWALELSHLEVRWPKFREALDKVLPGGLDAATLYTIDLRSHIRPSRAILHFKTTEDAFD